MRAVSSWLVPTALVLGLVSSAAPLGAQPWTIPVIEPGREAEIQALFAPYRLGGEVADGFRVEQIRVASTHIVCELTGPEGERATLRLHALGHGPEAGGETAGFSWEREATSAAGRSATDALIAAVRANDDGDFFRMRAERPREPGAEETESPPPPWYWDGLFFCVLGLLVLLVLVFREMLAGSRRVAVAVVLLTLIGAYLRLRMAPETVLGAWPYSRFGFLPAMTWHGPGLRGVLSAVGAELSYFEFGRRFDLAFAFFTPAAVFLHAKKLLGREHLAVLAAGVVVFLPSHIRFSSSEVAFIPSLALSSFTFALVHVALKDRSRAFRLGALIALPGVAALMFAARPLNQIFAPLLLWTALHLCRRSVPLRRRLLVSTLLTAVGVVSFVFFVLEARPEALAEGASLKTVWDGAWTFFTPHYNTLIHPWVTPLGLTVLAALGAWTGYRRGGRHRELAFFLLAWLALFYGAHAYVLPDVLAMQARYHLHLAVPFALLVALGADRVRTRHTPLFVVICVYVALSPVLHSDFIGDVEFDELREYAFVEDVAATLPAECTILEFSGPGSDMESRFSRVGMSLGSTVSERFAIVAIGGAELDGDPLAEEARAVLESPPSCLYYYEGLVCFGSKRLDEEIAPACGVMHRAELESVSSVEFVHRPYDQSVTPGLEPEATVRLTLYRVRPGGQ